MLSDFLRVVSREDFEEVSTVEALFPFVDCSCRESLSAFGYCAFSLNIANCSGYGDTVLFVTNYCGFGRGRI